MDLLGIYVNLFRIALVIAIGVHLVKHDHKRIALAAVAFALTFVPWLLGLIDFQLNKLTLLLFPAVVFMAIYCGTGLKFYNRFSWWDRLIHVLSGILFFSFGVSLAQKAPGVGLAGILLFSFTMSLALHVIWEVLEYLADCITHADNQRWQKRSGDTIHLSPESVQPPGLVDTMNDIIACIIGTCIALLGWWIALA